MNVESREQNGVTILSPQGRIDTRNTTGFEQAVMAHLDQAGDAESHRLLVNFAGLDYINSTGMRILLIVAKRLAAGQGKLVLCAMKPHILELFTISGFNQILTIRDTEAEALAEF